MTPYTGLTVSELTKIRTFLVDQLSGEVFVATNVPGLQTTRRLESLKDVRTELQLVNAELASLDPTNFGAAKRKRYSKPAHSTYQLK